MDRKYNAEEFNKKAIETMKSLKEHKYFEIVKTIDKEIAENQNPFDKRFYLTKQDQLNEAYGELLVAYSRMRAKLKTYVAVRKFEMKVAYEVDKTLGKMPGNEILEDLAKAEIPDVYNARLVLEGWVGRAENALRTCRSHSYGKEIEESFDEQEHKKDED
jgi:hypothetical protein